MGWFGNGDKKQDISAEGRTGHGAVFVGGSLRAELLVNSHIKMMILLVISLDQWQYWISESISNMFIGPIRIFLAHHPFGSTAMLCSFTFYSNKHAKRIIEVGEQSFQLRLFFILCFGSITPAVLDR